MKKRTLALLVVLALVLTAAVALVACQKTTTYKVSFYDGRTKKGEVEVEEGKTIDLTKIKDFEKKDGYTFVGWYDDSTFAGDALDLTQTTIKANTMLFGKWQNDTITLDTRIWYVMGSVEEASWSFPTTKDEETGEWSINEGMESQIMTQTEGKNEYTITLTVRADQKFRFVTGATSSDWTGDESKAEAGLGNMVGFAYAAGVNPEKAAEVTAESKEYGNVKKDDAIIFEGGKEYNDNPMQWNIFAAAGKEGIYKFTLTTYPGEDDRNTITYEYVDDLPVLDITFDPVIAGSMNDWGGTAIGEELTAEKCETLKKENADSYGEGVWTYTFEIETLEEGETVSFKVVNMALGTWIGMDAETAGKFGDGNFEIAETGTWLFVIDSVNKTYKLEKAAIRVVGTIDGQGWADGSQRGDGYKDNMYVMNKVESETEGVEKYELTLEITAEHAASWLVGKAAAIKVDFCAAGYSIWDCGAGENGTANIEIDTVGWYKVTLLLSYNEDGERQTNVTIEATTAPTTTPDPEIPETDIED